MKSLFRQNYLHDIVAWNEAVFALNSFTISDQCEHNKAIQMQAALYILSLKAKVISIHFKVFSKSSSESELMCWIKRMPTRLHVKQTKTLINIILF